MKDKKYWNKIVNNLISSEQTNNAAHIIFSNIDIFDEIMLGVDQDTLIKNCLYAYSLDFSAQPYLDEILSLFPLQKLVDIYKKMESKPIQTAGALMWLLEDADPNFSWMNLNG